MYRLNSHNYTNLKNQFSIDQNAVGLIRPMSEYQVPASLVDSKYHYSLYKLGIRNFFAKYGFQTDSLDNFRTTVQDNDIA